MLTRIQTVSFSFLFQTVGHETAVVSYSLTMMHTRDTNAHPMSVRVRWLPFGITLAGAIMSIGLIATFIFTVVRAGCHIHDL